MEHKLTMFIVYVLVAGILAGKAINYKAEECRQLAPNDSEKIVFASLIWPVIVVAAIVVDDDIFPFNTCIRNDNE